MDVMWNGLASLCLKKKHQNAIPNGINKTNFHASVKYY